MAAADADAPAVEAIEAFLRDLAGHGFSATTRRIRGHFLREYLRHAISSADDAAALAEAEGAGSGPGDGATAGEGTGDGPAEGGAAHDGTAADGSFDGITAGDSAAGGNGGPDGTVSERKGAAAPGLRSDEARGATREGTAPEGALERAGDTAARPATAAELMDPARARAWLADAAAGKTRTRGTSRGREAAAYPNSMRVRADTWNAFAEFLGLRDRLAAPKPADGFRLPPGEAEQLIHDLAVRRPVTANAVTALRTAAVAALVADTGRGVPELAGLTVGALRLAADPPTVELGEESFRLGTETVAVVSRWLSARAAFIAELQGSDPGHLWIPVKPGRPRGGDPPVKPGLVPAAVRTLHHAHRVYVSQMLGTPLRPGTLRALYDDEAVLDETAGGGAPHDESGGE